MSGEDKKRQDLSQRIFERVIGFVLACPAKVLAVAVVLTALAAVAIACRFDIRSDLKDLMPQNAQVVKDMYRISERMGSITTLNVFIKVPKLEPLSQEGHARADYQACLEEIGRGEMMLRGKPYVGENWCDTGLMLYARRFVSEVRALDSIGTVSFTKDKRFFEDNLLLYASEDELDRAYKKIDASLTEARRQSGEYKACLITADDVAECEALRPGVAKTETGQALGDGDAIGGFRSQLEARYEQTELASIREFPMYPITDGGYVISLEIRFKDSSTALKSVEREVKRIQALMAKIDLSQYDPTIQVEFGGGFNDMKDEYNAIKTDVVRSISVTILSIFLLIAIFFRSIRAAVRIFMPLVMSTLWALGITFVAVGYLNLITAFIFAILLGLGIDFGIHLYARYDLERENGHDVSGALRISVVETGAPLFFGAMTTAAAFFALMLGSFSGFSQFGFVAGLGVIIAFCVMTTVMPAWIAVSERIKASRSRAVKNKRAVSRETTRRCAPVMMFVSLITLGFAGYCATLVPDIQFEDNFYNLQLKKKPTTQTGNIKLDKFVKTSRPSSPVMAVFDNYDQVETAQMLITRDDEYFHFERYRKFYMKFFNTMNRLEGIFGSGMPFFGQNRSLPMFAALVRTLPDDNDFYDYLPMFVTYGSEKSQALQLYRRAALAMPGTMERILRVAPEAVLENRVANALESVVWMQSVLPEAMWGAIPTQRASQQLSTISDSASIFSFLPGTQMQQMARLKVIEKIRERTANRQIRFLPEEDQKAIRNFRKYLVDRPIGVDDLPEWVKFMFKEGGEKPLPVRPESGVDYSFGNLAVMYQTTSTYRGDQAAMLAHDARSLRIDGKPITVATGAFVYADLLELVKTDGMQIAAVALAVILLLAFIQQRHVVASLIVTLPVVSGIVVTIAVMVIFDLKLGLFNIVMLPVTLGIGIDGAIYLFQRYQKLGRGSCLQAVRCVIGPVFMSSSTTMVGFGGMITSQHMGLNSMGLLAIIGIASCFCATFLIQPGLILLAERLGVKKSIPDFDYVGDKGDGE